MIRHQVRLNAERMQPVSIHMPRWSDYNSASSSINPAGSTLRWAIWQETFWPKSGDAQIADAGVEGCKDR